MYLPGWEASGWQLLLIFFYPITLSAFLICIYSNAYLPIVDICAAGWTLVSIIILLVPLSAKAGTGRHNVSNALTNYDISSFGWGGFSLFIGPLLG